MPGALVKIDDYRQVAPRGTVDFLMRIGERLRGKRLAHVSASRYGALAESLNRVVPILNDLGVETTWEITIGTADFDQVTRAIAKGLAGTEQVITDSMLARLRETGADNAQRLRLDADVRAEEILAGDGRSPVAADVGLERAAGQTSVVGGGIDRVGAQGKGPATLVGRQGRSGQGQRQRANRKGTGKQ